MIKSNAYNNEREIEGGRETLTLGKTGRRRASRRYGRCGAALRYWTAWEGGQGAGESHRAGLRRRPGVDQENSLLACHVRWFWIAVLLLSFLGCWSGSHQTNPKYCNTQPIHTNKYKCMLNTLLSIPTHTCTPTYIYEYTYIY